MVLRLLEVELLDSPELIVVDGAGAVAEDDALRDGNQSRRISCRLWYASSVDIPKRSFMSGNRRPVERDVLDALEEDAGVELDADDEDARVTVLDDDTDDELVVGPRGAGGAVEPRSEGAMQAADREDRGPGPVAIKGHAPPTSPPDCSSPRRRGTMLAQRTLTSVLVARLDSSTQRRPLAWIAEPTTWVAILWASA